MPYSAKAIANEFLDRAERDGQPLDPIKLQKLVYFAHGWSLALRNRPLIDEQVEARSFGPVIPSLRRAFRRFGDGPIEGRAMRVRSTKDDTTLVTYPKVEGPDAAWVRELLDQVWAIYGNYTTDQLSNASHEEGSPWDRVWKEHDGKLPRGTDVPSPYIRDYFLGMRREKAATS